MQNKKAFGVASAVMLGIGSMVGAGILFKPEPLPAISSGYLLYLEVLPHFLAGTLWQNSLLDTLLAVALWNFWYSVMERVSFQALLECFFTFPDL